MFPPWTVIISFGGDTCQTCSNKAIISDGSVSKFNLKYWALNGWGPPKLKLNKFLIDKKFNLETLKFHMHQ